MRETVYISSNNEVKFKTWKARKTNLKCVSRKIWGRGRRGGLVVLF